MTTPTSKVINQDVVKEGFGMWKEYVETYNRFVLDATKVAFNQVVTFRESMDDVFAESLKQTQTLVAKEQETILNNVEAFNSQSKAAYRRLSKMATPITLN